MNPTRPLVAASLLALAGLGASCGTPSNGPSGPSSGLRLDSMAAREGARSRDGRARDVQPPPGIPESLLSPPALGPAARTPLDEALRLAAQRDADLPPAPGAPALTPAMRLGAARLYTQARAASLANDQQTAADLYAKVVAIDPTAAEAWAALAAIRAAAGDAPAAAEAWRNALANDPSNPRALEQLGLAALRRADADEALTLLARARANDPERADAAMPYLLDAALADALEQSGFTLAAAEAAERAALVPVPFDQPTNEQRRLLALLRQRGYLLRGAGDMRLRLGDARAAADDYIASLDDDETFDAAAVARAIYALRMAGADAAAAQVLVRDLERSQGRVDALELRLVDYLSSSLPPDIARAFADALPGIPERGGWDDSPAARGAAARLDAAGQRSPERAADVLLAHLDSVDADDAATEQLARTLADSPRALASSLARLAARNSLRAGQFTALFARAANDRAAFESALGDLARTRQPAGASADAGRSIGAGASLAQGWLALRTRHPERALAAFESMPDDPYAALGRIEALGALGRMRDAFAAADALASKPDAVSRLVAGAANTQLQRNDEAFSLLRALAQDASLPERDRTDALLYAAKAGIAAGQNDAAQRWLADAMERSPLREDSYAGLIQIGLAGGAQRNQAQLADVVRRLRENIPTSRTLRLLQARELAGQRQPAAAIEILTELLALDPRDEAAQDQYVATLVTAGQVATAESWLRDRLATDAAEPSTAVLLARVLSSSGRAKEADEVLAQQAERFPRSDAILRERETILRGPLNDPGAADERALERLRDAPPTIDNTLELAEVQARLSLWSESAASVERALSQPGVTLRRDQYERLARVAGLFGAAADAVDPDAARLIADAAGMMAETTSPVPDAVHRARVALLLRTEATAPEIIAASDVVAPSNRDLALQLRLAALQRYANLAADRPELGRRALEIARQGATIAGKVSPEMLVARVALAAQFDRPDEAVAAVRQAVESKVVAEAGESFTRMLGIPPSAAPYTADELAYSAAMVFGNEPGANDLYRLALEYNPHHTMSANNYGYGMLERGENVLEAYDLIQRAYAQAPDDVAVLDSMGWARYVVGVLDDVQNASGQPIEGAVPLLQRAAAMAQSNTDYLIHDHLGDAMWRAGRRDDAVRAWKDANRLLLNLVQAAGEQANKAAANDQPGADAMRQTLRTLREQRAAIEAKINAASTPASEPEPTGWRPELRDAALKIPVPQITPSAAPDA